MRFCLGRIGYVLTEICTPPEMDVADDTDIERDYLRIIDEYREDVKTDNTKFEYLGITLVQYARYHHGQGDCKKAFSLMEEGLDCYRKCDLGKLSVCWNLVEGIVQRLEWRVQLKKRQVKSVKEDLEEIQELLQPLRSASSYKEFVEQVKERLLEVKRTMKSCEQQL
ncbi:MAG: hypothetical protein ACTSUO_06565 [Candidatus Thorarchaeota archaeon]